jgi:uncharacterized protein (TIGR03066 family)
MKARFGAMMCGLMVAIAGCSSSSTTAPGGGGDSKGGATVVGKWTPEGEGAQTLPPGSFMEFTADGKIVMNLKLMDKVQTMDMGTYKVEGDKIHFSTKKGTKEEKETNTIKSLTADEMVLIDPKGKEEHWKRMK